MEDVVLSDEAREVVTILVVETWKVVVSIGITTLGLLIHYGVI